MVFIRLIPPWCPALCFFQSCAKGKKWPSWSCWHQLFVQWQNKYWMIQQLISPLLHEWVATRLKLKDQFTQSPLLSAISPQSTLPWATCYLVTFSPQLLRYLKTLRHFCKLVLPQGYPLEPLIWRILRVSPLRQPFSSLSELRLPNLWTTSLKQLFCEPFLPWATICRPKLLCAHLECV